MEVEHVPSKVSIGALLSKQGPKFLPVARCFLSDALRLEPTNRLAWFYLGEVHKQDGRLADAADCFQAASMLEDSDPVESFRSLWWVICNSVRFPFFVGRFSLRLPPFSRHSWAETRCPAICNLLYLQLSVCTNRCCNWLLSGLHDSSTDSSIRIRVALEQLCNHMSHYYYVYYTVWIYDYNESSANLKLPLLIL